MSRFVHPETNPSFIFSKDIHQTSTQLIANEYIKTDTKLHQLFTSWSKAEDPETGENVRLFFRYLLT